MRSPRRSCVYTAAFDRRGNVAMIFALVLIPVMGLVGAAVDYSRASGLRDQLHVAADAAALVAAKQQTDSWSDREEAGRKIFFSDAPKTDLLKSVQVQFTQVPNGVRVDVVASVVNTVASVIGYKTTEIRTMAEAVAPGGSTEVALVLDNTGSMRNDMDTLKQGAVEFTNMLFDNGSKSSQLKMALVPYVAAVDVGTDNMSMSWMDTTAKARWHGDWFRNEEVGWLKSCDDNPFPPPPSSFSSGNGGNHSNGNGSNGGGNGHNNSAPSPPKPHPVDHLPTGNDKIGFLAPLNMFARLSSELFGIKPARADVTANTVEPYHPGQWVTPGSPYVKNGQKGWLPDGFNYDTPCRLRNPQTISYFDLFNRIRGAQWKGCVEARAEPYDVTDDPPDPGNPDTLFVPYFWPDEPGNYGDYSVYSNNYMDDGKLPPGWDHSGNWEVMNLFKYDGHSHADIQENPPITRGPNKACPTEVVPLTNSRSKLLNAISTLTFWGGGGTVSSEGVMWGWRTLSPTPPFTEGLPYDPKNRKYIVLMSDGANSLVENNADGPTKSDYTAYGYLRGGRFGTDWFSLAENYLNDRMAQACTNAKAKGIKIMTILFREQSQIAKDVMRDCASDPSYAYYAADAGQLRLAFQNIASDIMQLRISK